MKGDFTRSTFRPEKHYTSVRMQQGRLQLDSDWNEQADIQTYLYHTQTVDLIGAESGVPTSESDGDAPRRDSFQIRVTPPPDLPTGNSDRPGKSDLAIAPGRLYVNGTLCELGGTPFEFRLTSQTSSALSAQMVDSGVSSNRVTVSTLRVDGSLLRAGQWVEMVAAAETGTKPALFQIREVDAQNLVLTLNGSITQDSGQMRRRVTYRTQPDYPNPPEPDTDGYYLVYLDVWQRHMTAIDDPDIREVALINTPDTTTRTKTIWQLKLISLKEVIDQVAATPKEKQELTTQVDDLEKSQDPEAEVEKLTQTLWQRFLDNRRGRSQSVYMNACAGLCPSPGGGASSGNGYRRLENQLYRVEIHQPGSVGDSTLESSNTKVATLKWSRDNGSVVSAIEHIRDTTILIQRSSQDAWSTSQSGQWIEITTEEMELKGEPGVMVPLVRASDTKIEFNRSRATGPIPEGATKVRRWDQMTQTPALLTRSDWMDLDGGIKIKFDKGSILETGDYWLIPARSATNDIEWPHDQGEGGKRQPLAQPPLGIQHDYCLLATVRVKDGKFPLPEDSDAPGNLKDCRLVFPPLVRCLDRAGGTITGNLFIDGKVGIGTGERAIARLHTRGDAPLPGSGKVISRGTTVTREGDAPFSDPIAPGDLLAIGGQTRVVTAVTATTLTLHAPLDQATPAAFTYQQAIARFADRANTTQFIVLANGNTGIGTATPQSTLEVQGTTHIAQDTFLATASGSVTIGGSAANESRLRVNGTIQTNTPDGVVIAGLMPGSNGSAQMVWFRATRTTPNQTAEIGFHNDQVQFTAANVQGYTFDKDLTVLTRLVTGTLSSPGNNRLVLQTNGQDRLAIAPQTGNVGIGTAPSAERLNVDGMVKATAFEGDGSRLTGVVKTTGDTMTGTLTIQSGDFTVSTGNVGLGTAAVAGGDRLTVNGSVSATTFKGSGADLTGVVKTTGGTMTGTLTIQSGDLTVSTGNVGLGTAAGGDRLTVNGSVSATTFKGSGADLTGVVKTTGGTINGALTLETGNFTVSNGNVGIGGPVSSTERLNVNGTVKATAFQGDGSGLTGVMTNNGGTLTGELTLQGANLTLMNSLVKTQRNNQSLEMGSRDGVWAHIFTTYPRVHFNQGIVLEAQNLTAQPGRNESIALHIQPANLAGPPRSRYYGLVVEDGDVALRRSNQQLPLLNLDVDGHLNADGNIVGGRLIARSGVILSAQNADLTLRAGNDLGITISQDNGKVRLGKNAPPREGAGAQLYIDGDTYIDGKLLGQRVSGTEIVQVSSGLLKDNIADLSSEEVSDILQHLNPVKFSFRADTSQAMRTGFIAEDTPDLLTSSDKQAIKILDVVAILTKAVKDAQENTNYLTQLMEQQQQEVERLREKIGALESQREHHETRHDILPDWAPQALLPLNSDSSSSPELNQLELLDSYPIDRRRRRRRRSLYHRLKRFFHQLFNPRRNTNRML